MGDIGHVQFTGTIQLAYSMDHSRDMDKEMKEEGTKEMKEEGTKELEDADRLGSNNFFLGGGD